MDGTRSNPIDIGSSGDFLIDQSASQNSARFLQEPNDSNKVVEFKPAALLPQFDAAQKRAVVKAWVNECIPPSNPEQIYYDYQDIETSCRMPFPPDCRPVRNPSLIPNPNNNVIAGEEMDVEMEDLEDPHDDCLILKQVSYTGIEIPKRW